MKGRIKSPYGMRQHPITGRRTLHTGIDIEGAGGTPIRAAAAGRVISAGWRGAYGVCVVLDHGSDISTLYGHCQADSLQVSKGQTVARGDVLARCGATGFATSDHLHFEVRRDGRPVDPMGYL